MSTPAPCGSHNARRRHARNNETCTTCDNTPRHQLAPCGTEAARRRHTANNQQCDTCGPRKTRPEPQPCGTPAAFQRHRRHGQTPCEPCRAAYRAADAAKRRKNPATTPPRSETNLTELLNEIQFLLNAGEGEHRILQATGYEGRAKSLRCRLTKSGHHTLAMQVFNSWELAA